MWNSENTKWKVHELSHLLEEYSLKNRLNSNYPVYSVTNETGFKLSIEYFSKEVFSKNLKSYKVVTRDAFAYNPSRVNVGSIDYFKHEGGGLVSPLYVTFRVKRDLIEPEYLKLYLKSSYGLSQIKGKTSGSVRDTLSFKNLCRITIPLPPVIVQKHILKILSESNLLCQKRRESIDLLNDYIKAIFLQMFGDPILNQKKLPLKKLSDLGSWHSGGTPPRSNKEFFIGDIPWYSSGELNDIYIHDSNEYISSLAIEKTSAKLVPANSLLLGMYDTAALKSSITKVKSSCNQAVAFCNLNSNLVEPVFLYHSIQCGKMHFKRNQRGVRQKNMNLSMIRDIEVPLPSIKEQRRFISIFNEIFSLKSKILVQQNDLTTFFDSLMQKAYKGEMHTF